MTLPLLLAAIVIVGLFVSWLVRRAPAQEYEMPGCLRCSPCGVSWPTGGDYQPCPECQRPTQHLTDKPIDADEARSRKNHADFERWLDEHDRRDPVEVLERIPVKDAP